MTPEINYAATIAALILAPISIGLDLWIVGWWFRSAKKHQKTREALLIWGVFCVFLSRLFIESYLGFVWLLALFDNSLWAFFYEKGVIFHVFFVQLPGIAAAILVSIAVERWRRQK